MCKKFSRGQLVQSPSGFTRVTAHRIAQPPRRPSSRASTQPLIFPSQAARQLSVGTPRDLGAVAMPLDLALERIAANPYFSELQEAFSYAVQQPRDAHDADR
jgi:hypothetical protein